MEILPFETRQRVELCDLTEMVQAAVARQGIAAGIAVLFSPHTTLGLTVNEHADPAVARDVAGELGRLIPPDDGRFRHAEGNADSHVKTSLVGPSLSLIVEGGRVRLGTWQGIFACEFDGPRHREVWLQVLG